MLSVLFSDVNSNSRIVSCKIHNVLVNVLPEIKPRAREYQRKLATLRSSVRFNNYLTPLLLPPVLQ